MGDSDRSIHEWGQPLSYTGAEIQAFDTCAQVIVETSDKNCEEKKEKVATVGASLFR